MTRVQKQRSDGISQKVRDGKVDFEAFQRIM